jgi:acetyl esterase/lipase
MITLSKLEIILVVNLLEAKEIFISLFKSILVVLLTMYSGYSAAFYNAQDINELSSKPADVKIAYGAGPMQYGELRLPKGHKPYPVIIILHGGCWQSHIATSQNSKALADALRDAGYATWNVEYRSADDDGGGWPGTFNDVGAAADFLRTIAHKYSLDLNHVVALGHSAGGHLALWLAARHNLPVNSVLYSPQPLQLRGVITLGGIPDLQAFHDNGEGVCGSDVIGGLLSTDPQTLAAYYPQASPKELLPLGVQQILIYGADDTIVPSQFGSDYADAAKLKGDIATVVVIANAGHFEEIAPHSVVWPAIITALQTLNGPPKK